VLENEWLPMDCEMMSEEIDFTPEKECSPMLSNDGSDVRERVEHL